MQTYDILMLVVLAGTTMFGFVKGLAWQVAYIASLVVSYFAALRFSPQLAPMFGDSEPFNRFVAMLVIYVGTSLVIWTVFRGVADAIDRVKLKEFDRQMGAIIGFARGVLWCIAITFFASTLLETYRPAILGSRTGHYVAVLLHNTEAVVPPEIQQVIGPYVDRVQEGLDPNRPAGVGFPGATPWPQTASGTGQGAWPQSQDQSSQPVSPPASATPAPWPQQSGAANPWPQQSSEAAAWPSDN